MLLILFFLFNRRSSKPFLFSLAANLAKFEVNSNSFILADFNQPSELDKWSNIFLNYETYLYNCHHTNQFFQFIDENTAPFRVLLLPLQVSTKNLILMGIYFIQITISFENNVHMVILVVPESQ